MKYFRVFDGETYHFIGADYFDVDERGYLKFFVEDDNGPPGYEVGAFNCNRWVGVSEKIEKLGQPKENNG